MNPEKKVLIKMRRCVGISIISLIPLCFLVSLFGDKWVNEAGLWCDSMSTFYWTNARNFFVGMTFVIGTFFMLYDGYNIKDKIVNITTGIFLILLNLFPTYGKRILLENFSTAFETLPFVAQSVSWKIHRICAIGIFIIQIYNIAFLFTKHSGEITEKKKQRNKIYKSFAIGGLVLLIINEICTILQRDLGVHVWPLAFVMVQLFAFTGIGVAWLIKGEALKILNDE